MQFRRLWVVIGVVPAALGCYAYTPLDTSTGVQAGEHVAVEITDRGRAELSDRLGAGVLRLEGTLTRSDSVDLVMNVWRVAQISGRHAGRKRFSSAEYASRVQTHLNRADVPRRRAQWWIVCLPSVDCSVFQSVGMS
jgi:hypothetical protein